MGSLSPTLLSKSSMIHNCKSNLSHQSPISDVSLWNIWSWSIRSEGLVCRTPTSHLQLQASILKSLEEPDFLYYHSAPQKDVFFHRFFCSLHSPSSRSIYPLPSHRSCPPHPISSDQGPRSHKTRCGLLHATVLIPRIPFDN